MPADRVVVRGWDSTTSMCDVVRAAARHRARQVVLHLVHRVLQDEPTVVDLQSPPPVDELHISVGQRLHGARRMH